MPSRRSLQQWDQGLYLMLGSLSMFFIGSVLAYLLIRSRSPSPRLGVPLILWFSTAMLLTGGIALQRSLWLVRRERQNDFRATLLFAWSCGLGFCGLQGVGMTELLSRHQATGPNGPTPGFLFVLVLLHLLHFLAGFGCLTVVLWKAWKGRYDHEYHPGVKLTATYWLFLDLVWLVMFGVFLGTA